MIFFPFVYDMYTQRECMCTNSQLLIGGHVQKLKSVCYRLTMRGENVIIRSIQYTAQHLESTLSVTFCDLYYNNDNLFLPLSSLSAEHREVNKENQYIIDGSKNTYKIQILVKLNDIKISTKIIVNDYWENFKTAENGKK